MQYMLMAFVQEDGWTRLSPAQQQQGTAAYQAYTEALSNAGVLRGSNRLGPSASATVVRMAGDKPQVLDCPFVDSKEQFGGYFLIEVTDLDAAISWAARCPAVSHGAVEVRPLWSMPA